MAGLTGVEGRRQRLKTTLGIVKAANPLSIIQATNLVSFNLGVTTDKAREYIDVLIGAGYIERDEEKKYMLKIVKSKRGELDG